MTSRSLGGSGPEPGGSRKRRSISAGDAHTIPLPVLRLESKGGARRPAAAGEPRAAAVDESPGDLLCATCRARITHEDHRVAMAGSHQHTFVNPGGFVHTLGCFGVAVNLSYAGEPETAFSWFPGFSWQVANCQTCTSHLGWIYRCAGDQFHGLLLAQLVSRGAS